MDAIKRIILWLALALACFLPAAALTPTAPENRIWEIFSIGYDAPTAEVTDLESRTETPTSNYDTTPIHRAATETKSTEAERPLFGPNAEFKAAEGAGDTTYLYQKLSSTGEHLKFGITKNPATRYTAAELNGGELNLLAAGPKSDMLELEPIAKVVEVNSLIC